MLEGDERVFVLCFVSFDVVGNRLEVVDFVVDIDCLLLHCLLFVVEDFEQGFTLCVFEL